MEKLFEITKIMQANYNHILTTTPEEQLFRIPEHCNNNIFWNIAHVLVTQQLLVYKLSNLKTRLDWELVKKYSKGTFPGKKVSKEELDSVSQGLLATPGWTKEDYEKGVFKEYTPYTTSAKVTINSVEDAIAFNIFHQGLHMGTIQSMQRMMSATA